MTYGWQFVYREADRTKLVTVVIIKPNVMCCGGLVYFLRSYAVPSLSLSLELEACQLMLSMPDKAFIQFESQATYGVDAFSDWSLSLYLVAACHLEIVNILWSHRDKCLLWPSQKPVNGTPIDKAWELLSSSWKLSSHRRHAQDHMQLCPHSSKQESVKIICCVRNTCTETMRSVRQLLLRGLINFRANIHIED